jgi:hypothetical protein
MASTTEVLETTEGLETPDVLEKYVPDVSHVTSSVLTLTKRQVEGQALEQYSYDPRLIEQALILGDMKQMDGAMRINFYKAVCLSVGLNPLTQPFTVMERQDKTMWLYANASCTQQLAAMHRVTFKDLKREHQTILGEPMYLVSVTACLPDGREVPSQSVVSLTKKRREISGHWPDGNPKFRDVLDENAEPVLIPLRGDALANAIMRADCVPLDSEILTREGWKSYDQVQIGEEVLAYDVESDVCQWTPLLNVTVHERLTMARLFASEGTFEVFCTPNHSWAVRRSVPYKVRQRGDGSRGPRGPYASRGPLRALIEAQYLKTSHHLILAAAVQDTAPSLLQPIEAAILGWAVTDGTIKRERTSVRIGICQSKEVNFAPIRELVEAVAPGTRELVTPARQRTFPSGHTYDTLPQHWWYLPAAISRLILDKAGFTSTADLPRIVTRLDHPARQAMLQAMMLGDGDQRNVFANTNRHVLDTFQILCALEGSATGCELPRPSATTQRRKKARHLAAQYLQLEIIGETPAWCPTTAYGTWVMRQRDRILITGNTKALRRATLALVGLGWMLADYQGRSVQLNLQTGELTPDKRLLPAQALMEDPAEHAKDVHQHIADRTGDRPLECTPQTSTAAPETRATPRTSSEQQQHVTPIPDAPGASEGQKGGGSVIALITTVHRSASRNDDWIRRYWLKMCKRFQVQEITELSVGTLLALLQEVRSYYQTQAEQASRQAPGTAPETPPASDASQQSSAVPDTPDAPPDASLAASSELGPEPEPATVSVPSTALNPHWREDLRALLPRLKDLTLSQEASSVCENPDATMLEGNNMLARVLWRVEEEANPEDIPF